MLQAENRFQIILILIVILILSMGGIFGYTLFRNYLSAENEVLGEQVTPTLNPLRLSDFEDFQTAVSRQWILLGDEFADATIEFTAELDAHQTSQINQYDFKLTYQLQNSELSGDMFPINFQKNLYQATIDCADLTPGEYQLQAILTLDASQVKSAPITLYVSYPVYVAWTLDWEGYDVPQANLETIDRIANEHNLPITHFYNPHLLTTNSIPDDRKQYLASWVKNRQSVHQDAIGLHLHMFPNMVTAAGVTPLEQPNHWGTLSADGYDIPFSEYSYADQVQILNWSKTVFRENGLEEPTIFRAGGWFVDEIALQSLEDTGFVLDSSGRTKYQLGDNQMSGYWDLAPTTQPYQPSMQDQNQDIAPQMQIWEFPNNGADSWEYTSEQLIKRFNDNYHTGTTNQKVLITYLSHPEWFDVDQPKIESLFKYIDQYSYQADQGPVVYLTLEQAYSIWQNE